MVVRTPSGKLIGVQLKSRVIVDDKKYGGRKLWMLFPSAPYHQNKPRDWYLIPHDQLLPRVEQSHGHLATWNKRWSAPVSKDTARVLVSVAVSGPDLNLARPAARRERPLPCALLPCQSEAVTDLSNADPRAGPRISFVSLGCPKALVDSERILTQLRAEGYELSRSHAGADAVIVNTCGFLDSAKAESLAAIGAAMSGERPGDRHRLHGRRARARSARRFPMSRRSPARRPIESVMAAVHDAAPAPHDPFVDLIPEQGVKLTPRHYAYLKISEGCHNRCTFCIIPKLRGDLVSRPAGEVLREAEKLVRAGVKELLVISQDTSAYGLDIRYAGEPLARPRGRRALPRSDARTRLARRLGAAALRLPLSACRRSRRADERAAMCCPISMCRSSTLRQRC